MVSFTLASDSSLEPLESLSGSTVPFGRGSLERETSSSHASSVRSIGNWSKSGEKPARTVHSFLEGELVVREDVVGGGELPPYEDVWLDSEVKKAVSIHNTTSSIRYFVGNVNMLDSSLSDNIFTLCRYLPTDRLFHG